MSLELLKQLLSIESITPHDNGCQELIIQHLKQLDFEIEKLPCHNVTNLWATRGTTKPLFIFAGHTDVVPAGDLSLWTSPPFQPTLKNNKLLARGAADMKGGIAAMLTACKRFISKTPQHKGTIGFLITSDEEGPSIYGTKHVVATLKERNIHIDYCLVGEASSDQRLGDTIKIGRRGSLSGKLIIHGIQGHIAYPQFADNPIHKAIPILTKLIEKKWDQGNKYFDATQFQISNIHAGTAATNMIPGHLIIDFNFRYSPEITAETLQHEFESILKNQLEYTIDWHHSGKPFYSPPATLVNAAISAIHSATGVNTQLSTSGGTSDGRFLIDISNELIELGPINKTIHQVNEYLDIDDYEALVNIYYNLLETLLRLS